MSSGGARLRQQYVAESPPPERDEPPPRTGSLPATTAVAEPKRPTTQPEPIRFPARTASRVDVPPPVVERSEMVKGYELEKGRFVLFTPEELKALQEASRQTIDIVSFIPERSVDPIYYDKAYYLTPDKRGSKPYTLLLRAMEKSGRCALAKWAWRSKQYVVQIRPAEGGLVLHQLLYADEVRSLRDLQVDLVDISEPELQLAIKLIDQISQDSYDPTLFVDEEKQRILAAVEQKIAGKEVVAPPEAGLPPSGNVVDLMEALRASLRTSTPPMKSLNAMNERKPAKRASSGVAQEEKIRTGRGSRKGR